MKARRDRKRERREKNGDKKRNASKFCNSTAMGYCVVSERERERDMEIITKAMLPERPSFRATWVMAVLPKPFGNEQQARPINPKDLKTGPKSSRRKGKRSGGPVRAKSRYHAGKKERRYDKTKYPGPEDADRIRHKCKIH